MAKIHSFILNYEPKSYADPMPVNARLDCSLGVNRDHIPKQILRLLKKTSESLIKQYPHNIDVVDSIIRLYNDVVPLTSENIHIGNGSYDLLQGINLLYLGAGKRVFSYIPHFSAYTDHIRCLGVCHQTYALKKELQYRMNIKEFIEQMRQSHADLVFLENPNNPTGQIIPFQEIHEIISSASELEMAIIVDEAYGDYMEKQNSAVNLVNQYENLFVTRSLSKGYGMAGIRFGYSIGSKQATKQLKKIITPFNCNAHARQLAAEILQIQEYQHDLIQQTKKKKRKILSALQGHPSLKIAHTSEETPLLLLYTENECVDLHSLLLQVGLASVNGKNFENLGKNAVRLMIPENTTLLQELLFENSVTTNTFPNL
jgi:histidinol-phosphate aminotransferase